MYKKIFIGIISTTLAISIVFILVAYLLSNKNIWSDAFTAKILRQHEEIAMQTETPKIFVISGSSTLFGVNTELMSRKLNYPVVNLGVHAGLRLDYIFYDAKKSIKNGDIVILPLEYAMYYKAILSEDRVVQIWQNDKIYFHNLSMIDKIQLLYSIPLTIELKTLKNYIGWKSNQDTNSIYMNINKTGDSINTIETKENINIEQPFNKNKEYLDLYTQHIIIDFLNYCKSKNVKVFITYPPYYYNKKYFDGYNLEQINKINDFWKQQDVTILGAYTDFIYTDKNNFYDTVYHLNIKGREKRTEKLIELLKPCLNKN